MLHLVEIYVDTELQHTKKLTPHTLQNVHNFTEQRAEVAWGGPLPPPPPTNNSRAAHLSPTNYISLEREFNGE